ncbi:MAG TPA: DNA recombination protein RmuC [Rhodopila sp.]|nr:DNA recombination protein RmuC [Rhodopila sp.]
MPVETIVFASVAVSLFAVFLAFIALRRAGAPQEPDFSPVFSALREVTGHLDGTLRAEAGRGRAEAGEGARALREEVGTAMRGFQDSVLKAMSEMQGLQKGQLETFASKLADGVADIERRVGGMAADLKKSGEAVAEAAERRHQALQAMVDGKLAELKASSSESDKALREEVVAGLKALGETLAANANQVGQAQRERLEAVAQEIANLTERHQAGQEFLRKAVEEKLGAIATDAATSAKALREEVTATIKQHGDTLTNSITAIAMTQKERLERVAAELAALTQKQEAAQVSLKLTVEQRLDHLRNENTAKLEQMRQTVDEKLQGTLEKRLGESFQIVSERLEQVHKGLGEMQSLANGVGDLKRVLTNVKTRGTWGEVQLGALLEQVLTPDQYMKEAVTRPGSLERVEFAIRLPGRGGGEPEVLLPVDAKFPHEDYERLMQAAERADLEGVELAGRQLEARVKQCARDIRDKYINPPHTTDFAILFLPTESLYAEVLRRPGLVEQVQREFRVGLAGPTTLGATLNALQMGFRTLAIEKRSSEVWHVLEAVKTEFGKYGAVLDKVQKKLHEASNTIDQVAVRRRAVDRKLREVATLPEGRAEAVLGLDDAAALADQEEEAAEA